MGRNFLIGMFLIGFFAAMMNNCSSRLSRMETADTFREKAKAASGFATVDYASSRPSRSSNFSDGSSVELQRESDGHFYADVQINGAPVRMLVDTGASGIALSRDDARSAGIATSIGMNDVVGQGADGSVHGEYVTIDRVQLGGTSASGLEAVVLNSGAQSLLGQEFLTKFETVEIHGNTMVLK